MVAEIMQLILDIKKSQVKITKTDVVETDLIIVRNMLKGILVRAGITSDEG